MRYLGIDTGKGGYVAILEEIQMTTKWRIDFYPCPTVRVGTKTNKRDYLEREMANLIPDKDVAMVILEKGILMGKEGISSAQSIGIGEGIWRGILASKGVPYMVIHPLIWKKEIMKGMAITTKDPTQRSIQMAQRLFPDVDLRVSERCRKPSKDKADALLLALYGYRIGGQK